MKPDLRYVAKFPNWSVTGCHVTVSKILLPKYGKHAVFRFVVTFIPVFSQ